MATKLILNAQSFSLEKGKIDLSISYSFYSVWHILLFKKQAYNGLLKVICIPITFNNPLYACFLNKRICHTE